MTDDVVRARVCAAGVAVLDIAGERVDEVAGQMRAVGRGQRLVLLALEVVMQDELAVVAGQDQVDARALEIGVEQEMRVGNDDRIRRRMHMAGIQMGEMGMTPRAFRGNRAVKFASVIQRATTIG